MLTIPTSLGRFPSLLGSHLMLRNLQDTQSSLMQAQVQLATGRSLARPADDAMAARSLLSLDAVISQRMRHLGNLQFADSTLAVVDSTIGELSDLLLEAKGIASGYLGSGQSSSSAESDAVAIDAILDQIVSLANRSRDGLFLFGGSATGRSPMVEFAEGWRYQGVGDGMLTDLGLLHDLPVTMSGTEVFGALSSRIEGDRDLDPDLERSTLLEDLRGARGFGVQPGMLSIMTTPPGSQVSVDLSAAVDVDDVLAGLDAVMPGVFSIGSSGLVIDLPEGVAIQVTELGATTMASDLGILGGWNGPGPLTADDLDPKLTHRTTIASLGLALGTIRVENMGQVHDVDLSGAEHVGDLVAMIEGLDIGIRVEVSDSADRLEVHNEVSGASMSIGEFAGGSTASVLGIRSMARSTLLTDFNSGVGVDVLEDLADLRITLRDGASFEVDLHGSDSVGDVLDAITAAAVSAFGDPPPLSVRLAATGNGIQLLDTSDGSGPLRVESTNGSLAAEQLGLLASVEGSTLTGADRVRVEVQSVFSHLADLRDALLEGEQGAIGRLIDRIEEDVERAASARAKAGHRSRMVADAVSRFESRNITDETIRSQLRDVDYTDASMRFATLQQQMQASLATTARISSLSLMDFLG